MPSFLELNLFTLLLFFAVALLLWFLLARGISSTRRMQCMMVELGLDYDLTAHDSLNIEAVLARAREKCLKCRSEDLCERWLSRKLSPDVSEDDFCPNAATFKELVRREPVAMAPFLKTGPGGGHRLH